MWAGGRQTLSVLKCVDGVDLLYGQCWDGKDKTRSHSCLQARPSVRWLAGRWEG